LEIILPADNALVLDDREPVVNSLLADLSCAMWTSPTHEAIQAVAQQKRLLESAIARSSEDATFEQQSGLTSVADTEKCAKTNCSSPLIDITFDADRILNCTIENGNTLTHGAGGRGYGLTGMPIVSGCYQWKVATITIFF
jgi:hypothetical protein